MILAYHLDKRDFVVMLVTFLTTILLGVKEGPLLYFEGRPHVSGPRLYFEFMFDHHLSKLVKTTIGA